MNVLQVSSEIDWRGGEQQLAYLAEELSKNNSVKQWIICPENSGLNKWLADRNIEHITYPKKFFHHFKLASLISNVCRKNKIDLVHLNDPHGHTAAIIDTVIFGNKTPLILSRKVDFPIGKNVLSKYKYNHWNVKRIICVSNAVKEILQRDIYNKNIVLTTIYDCIDTSRFQKKPSGYLRKQYNISKDTLLIGNVAALASHKDHFTFVDTAELIIEKNIPAKFIMIGTGPEEEAIRNYIAAKKMEQHIVMTGFVKDVEDVLPELDGFLFTSKTEGLGSSILDAYLSKVPVVATRAGGVPEIVKHTETGLLANVQSPQQLADAVQLLLKDVGLKDKIVANAYAFVQEFSKESMGLKVLQVLQEYSVCLKR